jgi:hypothetical protein
MHGPMNVKSNNISKWQMGFNSAFTGLIDRLAGDDNLLQMLSSIPGGTVCDHGS